jgi:hypothetical protein
VRPEGNRSPAGPPRSKDRRLLGPRPRRYGEYFLVLLLACHGKRAAHDDATVAAPAHDAGTTDATNAWPELATFPHVDAVRVIALPARVNLPRFDVGGPTVGGDVAVVSSSQFGFIAVDYHNGHIAWTKPAGDHVAPPVFHAGNFILIGECVQPPDVPDAHVLLGCLRVVTPTGGDQSYVAIHGRSKDLAEFASEPGVQRVWARGDRTITWRRGERAVTVDQITGVAVPTPAIDPPLVVHYKDKTWDIARGDDGVITAKQNGAVAWHTQRGYTELLGAVYLPELAPMVRVSNVGRFGGHPELNLMDMDATGSMHGQVAFPVPGIGLSGHTIDSIGDVALAVQLDTTLDRHFIVGYAANALLMWVYPLPHVQRADPIGLAIAPDAVVAFHDGDTVTILPELSAPPTSPGAARAPLENATP